MEMSSEPARERVIDGLKKLLSDHQEKRVCIVGTTCTGKSTMLGAISGARDQDKEVFPKLTPAEADYVCQVPWTKEIGRTKIRLVRERVITEPGRPVFGTVVLDCDLIILLKISEELLKKRCASRGVNYEDAINMHRQLLEDVRISGIPSITWEVG